VFAGHIGAFWFAGSEYPQGLKMCPVKRVRSRFRLMRSTLSSEPNASMTGHVDCFRLTSALETCERIGGLRAHWRPASALETCERIGDLRAHWRPASALAARGGPRRPDAGFGKHWAALASSVTFA
jgi:hypothetical protein